MPQILKIWMLYIIRKHKAFVVLFLTLTFLMYAKQYSSFTIFSDSDKADNVIYKTANVFLSGNCSVTQTERLPVNSLHLKKASFGGISFNQMLFVAQRATPCKYTNNVRSTSSTSKLQLICILRI